MGIPGVDARTSDLVERFMEVDEPDANLIDMLKERPLNQLYVALHILTGRQGVLSGIGEGNDARHYEEAIVKYRRDVLREEEFQQNPR